MKSRVSTAISLANATHEYDQVTHFSSRGVRLEEIWNLNADVIFIHNWFNFLAENQIVSIVNRIPTIFVAHDVRLATGGCHVTLGCQNFKVACKRCPASHIDRLAFVAKKSIDSMVDQLGRYAIVSPSNWLMNEIFDSPIIQRATVRATIANPSAVNPEVITRPKFRDPKAFKILFVAATLDAKYKGLDLLLDALSGLDLRDFMGLEIYVQIVGEGPFNNFLTLNPRLKIIYRGRLKTSEVHQLMSESDLLVVPSLTENYPGVIGEAQLLGCAVAASIVGGIPEMITDGKTGFLFKPDAQACLKTIIRVINSPNLMQVIDSAMESAKARHDEKILNLKYEKVIKDLMHT
jgi:glycosyltransferase involved in cell wall biosynthesis